MGSFSLRTKIIAHLAVVSLCAMSMLLLIMFHYVSGTLTAELLKRGEFASHALAEQSAAPILTEKDLALALLLTSAKNSDKDIAYVFILRRDGELLAHTFGKNLPAGLRKVGTAGGVVNRRVMIDRGMVIDIPSPILDGSLGTLHLGISEKRINGELRKIFFVSALVIVALFIAAGFLIWLSLEKIVIRPIKAFETSILSMQAGRLDDQLVPIDSEDEIGHLATSFNKMAEQLAVIDLQRQNVISELNEANEELSTLIFQREKAEARLAESEEKLRSILDSAGEAIYGLDRDGNCTFCNRSCIRLLGYASAEQLIGRNMHSLIHHSRRDGTYSPVDECSIYRAFKKGENTHVDNEVLWKADGTALPVEYWSFPQVQDGEIVGAVVTFVDISQRIEAEEENKQLQDMLYQSQKMDAIGTLAGGIAHDFNNILSVIYGYLDLAFRRCSEDTKLRENLQQIRIASERAKELVAQILTFSRKTEVHRHPLELAPLIKETLKLIRSSLPANITIKQQLEVPAVVVADPTQIHQVIMNLCTNAYHAMVQGGTLAVGLKTVEISDEGKSIGVEVPSGTYAVLEVSDTGCGMDDDTRQKIFEPYFTTRGQGKGSGLGLAVVHGIIKGHGGRITVYSELGSGSTFHVYLPLATSKTDVVSRGEYAASTATNGERIMFVDDEEQIREVAVESLTEQGYRVHACSNGIEALELLKKEAYAYDLVVTDMAMPGLSGKELAQCILAVRPAMPIILCTGYSELINGEGAKGLGIRDYVQKPVTMSQLGERIRSILDSTSRSAPL